MLKKFSCGLIITGALLLSTGMVNAVFVGSTIAQEQRCKKCGHLPSKPEGDCKCQCHRK
ncbi:MAG: hypothetical protein NG784_03865 [Candidatus Jettenia sp.]|nr:hypothetical protein [Candidatus Jettenia sp.]